MSNPFALLQDEGDSDRESQPTPVTAATKKAAPAAAPAKPVEKKTIPGQAQPRGKPDYPGRGGARKVFNDKPVNDGQADAEPQKREGKGQRGGKAGRSRGGGRADRHSNTARTDSDKQEHQGWGLNDDGKRELADEQNGWNDAKADESAAATPARDEAQSPAPAAEKEPVVEEDPTKTYDEYLAESKSADWTERLGLSNLSLRKANEGADDAQWKNAKALVKEDEDADHFFAGGNKESKTRKRPTKEGKTYLEVEARFPRPERPSRGRGEPRGRGGRGGRGGEGRGRGGRPQPSQARPVDTSDASAFPSLS